MGCDEYSRGSRLGGYLISMASIQTACTTRTVDQQQAGNGWVMGHTEPETVTMAFMIWTAACLNEDEYGGTTCPNITREM